MHRRRASVAAIVSGTAAVGAGVTVAMVAASGAGDCLASSMMWHGKSRRPVAHVKSMIRSARCMACCRDVGSGHGCRGRRGRFEGVFFAE